MWNLDGQTSSGMCPSCPLILRCSSCYVCYILHESSAQNILVNAFFQHDGFGFHASSYNLKHYISIRTSGKKKVNFFFFFLFFPGVWDGEKED